MSVPHRPPVVLIPYLTLPSFLRRDLVSVRKRFQVNLVECRGLGGLVRAVAGVIRSDLLLCWFGSLRFLPIVAVSRILGKRICIVAGGYDVAAMSSIGYGTMARPWSRRMGRWLFAQADVVAAFSASAAREARENARVAEARLTVIPLGFDPPPPLALDRERMVLCVSNIDHSTIERKNLRTVAQLAARMPDLRFVLVGAGRADCVDALRTESEGMLELPGRVDDDTLARYFALARVYLQPSLHEGFGAAVAEAMLHGCIPVVTPCFSLPEVVGPCGLYAEPEDLDGLAACITAVVEGRFNPPEPPRTRILREFPAEHREQRLLAVLEGLLLSSKRFRPAASD